MKPKTSLKDYPLKMFNIPSNNFAENPRKLSFTGKSGENVDSYSEEFLVTHSEEFLVTRSDKFLVTRSDKFLVNRSDKFLVTYSEEILITQSMEFLVTNSAENPEEMSTKFVEILGNFQRKVLQNQFLLPRGGTTFLCALTKAGLAGVTRWTRSDFRLHLVKFKITIAAILRAPTPFLVISAFKAWMY